MSDSKVTGWDKIDKVLLKRLIRLASPQEREFGSDEDLLGHMVRQMHQSNLRYRVSFIIEIDNEVEWSVEDTIDLVVISKIGRSFVATGTISTLQCLADDDNILSVKA